MKLIKLLWNVDLFRENDLQILELSAEQASLLQQSSLSLGLEMQSSLGLCLQLWQLANQVLGVWLVGKQCAQPVQGNSLQL